MFIFTLVGVESLLPPKEYCRGKMETHTPCWSLLYITRHPPPYGAVSSLCFLFSSQHNSPTEVGPSTSYGYVLEVVLTKNATSLEGLDPPKTGRGTHILSCGDVESTLGLPQRRTQTNQKQAEATTFSLAVILNQTRDPQSQKPYSIQRANWFVIPSPAPALFRQGGNLKHRLHPLHVLAPFVSQPVCLHLSLLHLNSPLSKAPDRQWFCQEMTRINSPFLKISSWIFHSPRHLLRTTLRETTLRPSSL